MENLRQQDVWSICLEKAYFHCVEKLFTAHASIAGSGAQKVAEHADQFGAGHATFVVDLFDDTLQLVVKLHYVFLKFFKSLQQLFLSK